MLLERTEQASGAAMGLGEYPTSTSSQACSFEARDPFGPMVGRGMGSRALMAAESPHSSIATPTRGLSGLRRRLLLLALRSLIISVHSPLRMSCMRALIHLRGAFGRGCVWYICGWWWWWVGGGGDGDGCYGFSFFFFPLFLEGGGGGDSC